MITCSIGICVFNEEKNIGKLLTSVLRQQLKTVRITEIVIIASGSTDKTCTIVKDFQRKDKRIKLIKQKYREGKAVAVNLLINQSKNDILLLAGGDLILKTHVIEKLVSQFSDEEVGMTGARPVPVNDIDDGLSGFAAHLLWDLHHRVSLKTPKMGEVIAFRRIFKRIPVLSSVDEANIEPLIRGQGYKVLYVPQAIILNRAPDNLSDFIKQRRRVYSGHLAVKHEQSYEVATMHVGSIIATLTGFLKANPKITYIVYIPSVIVLEAYSRLLGWWDYRITKKKHTIWEEITSTKELKK